MTWEAREVEELRSMERRRWIEVWDYCPNWWEFVAACLNDKYHGGRQVRSADACRKKNYREEEALLKEVEEKWHHACRVKKAASYQKGPDWKTSDSR